MHKFLSNYPFFILSHFSHLGPPCVWEDILHLKRMPKDADLDTVFENTEDHDIINSIAYRDTAISHGLNHYNYVTNQYVQLDEKGNIVLHGELYIKPFLHDRSLMISAKYFNRGTQQTVEFEDVKIKMPTEFEIDIEDNVFKLEIIKTVYEDPVEQFVYWQLYSLVCEFMEGINIRLQMPENFSEYLISRIEARIKLVNTTSHDAYTDVILPFRGHGYKTALNLLDYEAMANRREMIDQLIDKGLYIHDKEKCTVKRSLDEDKWYYILGIRMLSGMLFRQGYTGLSIDIFREFEIEDYDVEHTTEECDKIKELLNTLTEQKDVPDEKFFALRKNDFIYTKHE